MDDADQRDSRAPLYDPRFEHDACGVGFVADAGGRSRARVLPLALAGLASLGHRGAFGADGESSDGAGIALPLDRSVLTPASPAPSWPPAGPASSCSSCRASRAAASRARAPRRDDARRGRAAGRRLARGPGRPAALGAAAAASLPGRRPGHRRPPARAPPTTPARSPTTPSSAGWSSPAAASRSPPARPARRSPSLSIPSASCRTIVYKGLVAGGRLPDLYPDLRAPLDVRVRGLPPALRHEHAPDLGASPSRSGSIAHNGEINTVRGNREQVRGRTRDRGAAADRRRADRGRPAALAGRLRLAVARRGPRAADHDRLGPDAGAARGHPRGARRCAARPHPHVATLRRRTAGMLAPWDGPAAIVFADGQRVGALIDRNGLRPASLRGQPRSPGRRRRPRPGPSRSPAAETIRRGRLGPGELLLVEPGRRAILEDTDAKAWALRAPADPRRAAAVPRGRPPTPRPRRLEARPALDHVARYLAGLDAERARLDIKTMALEAHEPLWSMGDDTPTAGRGRLDRPVADHLRQAFAQVTNPAIDPERERIVMDLRVELGRRPALLGGPPRGPRTLRLERPIVADLDGLRRALRERRPAPARRSTRRGRRRPAPPASTAALDRLAARRRARRRAPASRSSSSATPRLSARAPAGPVDPRGRRRPHRPDRRRPARPDRHRRRRRRHPRRPRHGDGPRGRRDGRPSAAGHRAGRRAGRDARRRGRSRRATPSPTSSRPSRPACARPSPGWASAPSPRTSAARSSTPSTSRPTSSRAASRWPRPGPAGRPSPTWPIASSAGARPRSPCPRPRPAASRACPTRASPGSAPTARPTCSRRPSPRRSRSCPARCGDATRPAGGHRRRAGPLPDRPRPAASTGRPCPRDELRVRRLRETARPRRRRGRPVARAPVRRLGDERRRPVAGGAPGADHRHPAGRRGRQHRRGRRGPGVVRAGCRRPSPRRPDQAGRLGALRGDRDVPRPGRPARDQDRPGLQARRGRPAARPQGDGVHRGAAARPARPVATSARRRTTTSTRSRTWPSSSPTCAPSTRARGSA